MATTSECQAALGALIVDWFANAAAQYDVPIPTGNIKAYNTSPTTDSVSPNWCILRVLNSRTEAFVAGGMVLPARLIISLFSRFAPAADAEAAKQAAEYWLNDAEEMLLEQIADLAPTDEWHSLDVVGQPRRDADPQFWGAYRTSQIVVDIDKR